MVVAGKRVVVTGCASGIGKHLVEQLAGFDCDILAVDINLEGIPALPNVHPFQADLSSQAGTDSVFEEALRRWDGIDLFIANAGFAYYEEIASADWERIEAIYRVNVFSPLYTAAKMKELFRERPYRVVINSSAMGKLGIPGYALYTSTKAAVDAFAQTFRFEPDVRRRLSVVYPIGTRTHFFEQAGSSIPRTWPTQEAETVARRIIRGIRRDHRSIFPSRLFQALWVLHRVFPVILWLEQKIEQGKLVRWLKRAEASANRQ